MKSARRGIPLDRDISSRILPWLIAIMVYLIALALFSVLSMNKISGQWDSALSAHITVQLPPAELTPADQPVDVEAILELLQSRPGIASAKLLDKADIDRLMEPWLGTPETTFSMPLPQLIAVTLQPAAQVDTHALSQEIRNISIDALVVDHKKGLEGLIDLAGWIRLISAGVIVLIGVSAILMAVLITKMGLAAHAPVIELLHLMGAEDRYVAEQFQRHALIGGLMGGLIGLALSLATFAIIEQITRGLDHSLVPNLSFSALQWAILFTLPLAAAGVTTLTVRLTVQRSLARLP
jgi:cell division transport system permease protein